MKKFFVHLLAFSYEGLVRLVEVPMERLLKVQGFGEPEERIRAVLELVFEYGQNDFQPRRMPSVSAGDVILYDGEPWLVLDMGFLRLSEAEYATYQRIAVEFTGKNMTSREMDAAIPRERMTWRWEKQKEYRA